MAVAREVLFLGSMHARLAWPEPRSTNPLVRALRALWTLPTNVVGHAIGLVTARRRPRRIGGPAAEGWAYSIGSQHARWLGAITLGDVVLHSSGYLDGLQGRIILAHELAHVRQHAILGPFYLPAHAIAQVVSALATMYSEPSLSARVHAKNPLEQRWICLGFDACAELARNGRLSPDERERYLCAFGV